MTRPVARGLLALLLTATGTGAAAHDTWLSPVDNQATQLRTLALHTGERYPLADSGHAADNVAHSGCVGSDGGEVALRPREAQPTALLLRARAAPQLALACWVEMRPRQAELDDAAAGTYLHDIRAPAALVARWQELRRRGVPWRETYIKQARLELPGDGGGPDRSALRVPLRRGLEIVPLGPAAPRAGEALRLRVLRDGRPLQGLPVEFVSERSRFGVWRRSDARGQIEFTFPFAGRWLLRGTELEAPTPLAPQWRGRFATLLLQVD